MINIGNLKIMQLIMFTLMVSKLHATPNNPENLAITEITNHSVKLSWDDVSSEETGFKILRDDKLISIVSSNITSYIDTGLNANTSYTYTVKSTDDAFLDGKISYFQDFSFNAEENTFVLRNSDKITNPYEVSFSNDKKHVLYTSVSNHDEPEVYSYDFDTNTTQKLTDNIFIETNPVINNDGVYAYIQSYTSSSSKVYLNGSLIEETSTPLLYKNMAISSKYLIYGVEKFQDNTHFLHWIDLDTDVYKTYSFDGYIQKIGFLTDKKALIQYFSLDTMSMDVGIFDLENSLFEIIKNSIKDELIKDINFNQNFKISTIANDKKNIKLLFNAYHNYYNYQLANPFASSNNFMGRMTWNQSYRLKNITKLYNLTQNPMLLVSIDNIIQSLLDSTNEKIGISGEYNAKYSYSTRIYSIGKETNISLLVTDAKIYNVILFAMKSVGGNLEQKYTDIVQMRVNDLYNYYENYYDSETSMYKFQYGINFLWDGVWLPFNQQNLFAMALLQMYDLTQNEIYRDRVFVMAQKFKDEFVYTDNKLLWHYWSSEFYNGWSVEQNISKNRPSRAQTEDTLYEDLSHAGTNINFILEFQKRFPDEVFISSDISLLNNTIDSFTYNNFFSRFMSGDIVYQAASFRFIPSFGWGLLGNQSLNNLYVSLNPFFYADWDSQAWDKYIETIDVQKLQNENLSITIEQFDITQVLKESLASSYDYENIHKYFEIEVIE